MKKAIVFGASGFIGSHLVEELLNDPDYIQITCVVRKPLSIQHPKLKILIGDFNTLPMLNDSIEADVIFIALGTTKKKTPDQKEYYRADHDYPVLAAKIAKEKGAKEIFVVTAVGANPNSAVFYIRTKGELERDILALDYEHTHFFQPSMITGQRKENRPLEKVFIKIWSFLNPLLMGPLKNYKGMDGKDIAKAMHLAGKKPTGKVTIYHWKEMNDLLL
jgi:uncharacterized protein YbjT (DUF2867 family)